MSILEVENLCKTYSGAIPFQALKGVSFKLKKGEILGLLGSNGAGKTTTLQILLGSLKPTSGQVVYFGKDFFKNRSEVLEKVSFAGTYISLPWNLTVAQNLKVISALYGVDPETHDEKVDVFLDRFGLLSKKHVMVGALSSGQISRLMLIKAFFVEPKIVLLDEPTAAMDADVAKDVLLFLKEQREMQGTSILYTSHNLREIDEICDRVIFMEGGKIVENDTPQQLAQKVANCRVQIINPQPFSEFCQVTQKMELFFEKEGDRCIFYLPEGKVDSFIRAIFAQGIKMDHFYIDPPSIEGYFLHRVGQAKQRGGS